MKKLIFFLLAVMFNLSGTTPEITPTEGHKRNIGDVASNPNDEILRKWNIRVDGFSPAYFDKPNQAFAVNTIQNPTDKWGAAMQVWDGTEGLYQMNFTSLCELDGESSYKVKVDGLEVLSFTNPFIFDTGAEDYKPFKITVYNIRLKKGSVIQVEFLPHSNNLIPENDAFAFARARWRDIEFLIQTANF